MKPAAIHNFKEHFKPQSTKKANEFPYQLHLGRPQGFVRAQDLISEGRMVDQGLIPQSSTTAPPQTLSLRLRGLERQGNRHSLWSFHLQNSPVYGSTQWQV